MLDVNFRNCFENWSFPVCVLSPNVSWSPSARLSRNKLSMSISYYKAYGPGLKFERVYSRNYVHTNGKKYPNFCSDVF